MARVITGDQADTPITDIPIGIAGSGGTATGAIGRACHDEGHSASSVESLAEVGACVRIALSTVALAKAEAPPQPERRSSTVIL